jgi:hypothetical protein
LELVRGGMLVVKELKDERRGINRNPVLHVQGFLVCQTASGFEFLHGGNFDAISEAKQSIWTWLY